MIKYIVAKSEDGKTLERILLSHFPIERNGFYKALRKKDIKINGKRITKNIILHESDLVEAYIFLKEELGKCYTVLYQNSYILIVDKKQGVPAMEDKNHETTLIAQINNDFQADYELCHRIDRNTGGIVVISKQTHYTDCIKNALNERYYNKIYQCLVWGDARKIIGLRKAWHFKDSSKNQVYIYSDCRKYTKEIATEILSVQYDPKQNISKLEINLITGRTHQIRAHLAFLGFPILGDGKYRNNEINKKFAYKYQALWACALIPHNIDCKLKEILPEETIRSNPAYE